MRLFNMCFRRLEPNENTPLSNEIDRDSSQYKWPHAQKKFSSI